MVVHGLVSGGKGIKAVILELLCSNYLKMPDSFLIPGIKSLSSSIKMKAWHH